MENSNIDAIKFIEKFAQGRKDESLALIKHVLKMINISLEEFNDLLGKFQRNAKVALHFHPDRICQNNKLVIENMLEDGYYRNQFETLMSNGGLNKAHNGAREIWESELFGNSYNEKTLPENRPKYGALDFNFFSDGPAPRFGSCYFLLKPSFTSERCTFTFQDSNVSDQLGKGTLREFYPLISEVLKESFIKEILLGNKEFTPYDFIKHLENVDYDLQSIPNRPRGGNLNSYIEAQVHGKISLEEDIFALVCDPSFKEGIISPLLFEISKKYNIPLFWHKGHFLKASEVKDNFRGPFIPLLAQKISPFGTIDTAIIGEASRVFLQDPESFNDLQSDYCDIAKGLKFLWHTLVRFGDSDDPRLRV